MNVQRSMLTWPRCTPNLNVSLRVIDYSIERIVCPEKTNVDVDPDNASSSLAIRVGIENVQPEDTKTKGKSDWYHCLPERVSYTCGLMGSF